MPVQVRLSLSCPSQKRCKVVRGGFYPLPPYTGNGEITVLIYRIDISIHCLKCKDSFWSNKRLGVPVNPESVIKFIANIAEFSVPKDHLCSVCNTASLEIKRIRTFTMPDMYGDTGKGYWTCPTHKVRHYYPIPIRDALANKDKNKRTPLSIMQDDYNRIVISGFPWRCPICRKVLQYKHEDYDAPISVY